MKHALVILSLCVATTAVAHPVFSTTRAAAAASQEVVLKVGHGCEGADTSKIELQIPEGVTAVRPMHAADFGKAVLTKDDTTGNVTAVTWAKADEDVLAEDSHLYKFTVSLRLPERPFTRIFFPVIQTCRTSAGEDVVVEWTSADAGHGGHGGHGGHEGPNPAASLFLMPPVKPGWNRFTVNEHVHDLTVFDDALIVWSGKAAYSSNARTRELISNEPDVQSLAEIHPGMEIWLKY